MHMPWAVDAACRSSDVDFFSESQVADAKAVCAGCPVQADCLSYALAQPRHLDFGVWGGLTARERQVRKRRRVVGAQPIVERAGQSCPR